VEQFESFDRDENVMKNRRANPSMLTPKEIGVHIDHSLMTLHDTFKTRSDRNADRSEADQHLANAIRHRAQVLRESAGRPTRITKTSLLKHFGQLSKFTLRKAKYPSTAKALEENSESRTDFLERKINWGLDILKAEGRELSMNSFRRLITTPASVIIDRKELIANLAARLGIMADERSAFASALTEDRCDRDQL
jgi:hypothetical protein